MERKTPVEGTQFTAQEEVPAPPIEDEDAALAWLESLAARQGALEEELLTAPEERLETPPEWVQQLASEEAETTQVEGLGVSEVVTSEAAVSEVFEGEAEVPVVPAEAPEHEGLVVGAAALAGAILMGKEEQQPTEEMAPAEEVEVLAEAAEAITPTSEFQAEPEAIPATELETPEWIPEEELRLAEIESPEPAAEPEPELPDWLRGFIEEEQAPPTVEAEPVEPALVAFVAGQVEPEEALPPVEPLDINAASLAQLERLPGVGFILAQNLVSYRDTHGAFHNLDELQEVPGVSAESAQELRRWLTLEIVEETVSAGPPPSHPVLADAWQNVAAGDTQAAVEKYSSMIEKGENLDQVIQEIQEALQLRPTDSRLYQTLGDAYLRTDRLEEALDAYNRAEELLG
jgi:competence ComEA-like helix-hairpin-helix protein